jgi:hypothetical protein
VWIAIWKTKEGIPMPQETNQPPRPTGSITIDNLDQPAPGAHTPNKPTFVATHRYIWRPSSAIELPPDFELSFDCNIDADGIRRFVPTDGVKPFILQASLGGSVLLRRYAKMTREERQSYRAMHLIFQVGSHVRERFGRRFKTERDLYLPTPGRLEGAHVLPERLGLGRGGAGKSWKPQELIERGRACAKQAGVNGPNTETCIRFGLLEAARQDPLSIDDPDECRKIVRLGLFDLGPDSEQLTETAIERVQGRLLGALHDHLEDDADTFNHWFFEEFNSVVGGIAKQKGTDGPIKRSIVRQAILETVFRAYPYVGQCVNVQMRDFLQCLPEPLNASEHAVFDPLYLRQSILGNLPLILLHERLGFLSEIVLDIFEKPQDKAPWGVVLRMLQYYGEMVSKKRAGDRRYKQQTPHRNIDNRSGAVFSLDEAQDQAAKSDRDLFQNIAAELRELRQAKCRCATSTRWRAETVEGQADDELQIKLRETCELCGHSEECSVSREQFAAIGKRLMEERAGEYW